MPVIVSQKHQALVVPKAGTEALFPNAPALGPTSILLKHDAANTLLLRHLGYKVPSPMPLYYHYPHPDDEPPFKTQIDTTTKMSENHRFYNLNDKGTGKTRCALWAWDYLYRTGACKKLLVVAPLSTLHFTWKAEVFKINLNRKVAVLYGTKKQRLTALASDAEVFIINHDGLKVVREELERRTDIDCLVLDELAVYRNNSDRSKEMRRFAARFGVVWGLTGSPMPQEPTDVWGQAKIVRPATVPKYRKALREMLMTQISQYKWVPRPNAVEQAFNILQPNCRYALSDVTELPETIYRNIEVAMSSQQNSTHKTIKKELTVLIKKKVITAVNAGVALNKLLQIAGGWVYSQNPAFVRLDAAPRMAALINEIEASAHKVIVFIPWRHAIEGIADIFERLKEKERISFESYVIHGDTKNRETILGDFQNITDPADLRYRKVLLAHPKTIHHGVTLTTADTVIWYCPTLSFDIYDQANARVIRAGQKHKQQILHLVGTKEEKSVYASLRAKDNLQDKLLEMLQEQTEKSVR